MKITENTNLNGALEVTNADGTKKIVVAINTNLVENSNNCNFSFTVLDTILADANAVDIQTQMDEFIAALRVKMIELGYKITL